MKPLDSTDQKLIALLRSNARMSVVEIADKLSVSRATVQNRLGKLEKSGVIMGYTVTVRPSEHQNPIRAIMSIKVNGRTESKISQELKGLLSIVSLFSTNGRWDLIAMIETETLESFNETLNQVRLIEGISETETSLLLDSHKL